jgi:hypothetical protein
VGTGAKDTSGNHIADEFKSSFTTLADTFAPDVLSVAPNNGAIDVAITANVSITFSEPMDQETVRNAFSLTDGGTTVGGDFSWNGSTMTFNPTVDLDYSTTYTVSVTDDAEDTAGNNLAPALSSSFTTASQFDTTSPYVTAVSPLDGATGVSVAANVSVTFSEQMDHDLTENAFSLTDGGTTVGGDFSWNGETMTFNPTSDLKYGTAYAVIVDTTATDTSGNPLDPFPADIFTSSFTTVEGNNAPVLSAGGVSPLSGSASTSFTYSVQYFDADGDQPSQIQVFIDSVGHTMWLYNGDPSNGNYSYTTTLSEGSHTYYFSCSDGADGARLPSSGENNGPTVSAPTTATVEGTFTMPGAANGAGYWVTLQNSNLGTVTYIYSTISGTGTSVDYSIPNVTAGTYYVWVLVNMDGVYAFSNGDFSGYYGGTGLYPPVGGPNLVVPASGTVSNVNVNLTTLNKVTVSGTITFENIGVTSGWVSLAAFTQQQWGAFEPYWDREYQYTGQSTMPYSIDVQAGDALFIGAFIDLDGDDVYEPGVDAAGGYPLVGGVPGFVTYTSNTTGVDFTVYGP